MSDIFNDKLTAGKYANFVWPSILMMVVLSLYYTIDTIFVARYIGEEGLAAINIVYPIQGMGWGFAVMLAAGSSALVAIEMGKGKWKEAKEKFSLACVFSLALGGLCTLMCIVFMDPIVQFLGATEVLTEDCRIFLSMFMWGIPAAFIGVMFEFFIRTDGKPMFTILLYIAGGIVHLGLDILFMGPMQMGLTGAALANIMGLLATALMGLYYFLFKNTRLKFTRFGINWKYIGKCFMNGSPELVNEAAGGLMVFFYNIIVIKITGEVGVASCAVVLQIHYLMMSFHIGYQAGSMPLISYFYGAKEFGKINQIMRYTRNYIISTSLIIPGACALCAPLIAQIYTDPGTELFDLCVSGLRIVSISLIVVGINVFGSGFFTCFGNGIVSSVISLSRGIILLVAFLYLLSHFFGMNGAWVALPAADLCTLTLTFGLLQKNKKKYHYRILG